jgi:hypothetical protein
VSIPRLASRSDSEARDKASSAGRRLRKRKATVWLTWLSRMHFYLKRKRKDSDVVISLHLTV